mgnify:CR=1 FL=1
MFKNKMQLINHNNTETFMVVMTFFLKYNPSFLQFNFKVNTIHICTAKTNYNSLLESYWSFSFFFEK